MSAKTKVAVSAAAAALAAMFVVALPTDDANATVKIKPSNQMGCSAQSGLVRITFYELKSHGEYNFAVFAGKKLNGAPLYIGTHKATIGGVEAHVLSCPNLGKGDYTVALLSRETSKTIAMGTFAIR